jgi:hypothetical protein
VGHSISRKSHALSSSCNIDHFVVQLILRLRQAGVLHSQNKVINAPPAASQS